ncbi:hypothetical protein CF326_g8858 [Tilletia indica]|nr:hypothetical protein CF326_g8858 [Tilletia indica]
MLMDLLSTTLVRHILLRADRCDALPTVSTRSATYLLPQVLNANDLTAEAAIREHTRAFPRQVNSEWQEHLISLHPELERALAPAKKGVYEIKRPSPEKVIGVKLFDSLRKDAVHIRSLAAFRDAFATFGGSVLAGLDYSNIFIAGGSILATLTELDTGNFDDLLKGSDIDIFLYGLSGEEAHNKIISIANTIRSNVKDFDAKYLVERSAGTVSFLPHQGAVGRKIQVILRLARNPAEILAGFDFDEVCVGYDGTSVWLDLRAIRALRTGYTSTTGAISSSFAARVVKYATRGYGVKIECPNEDDRRLSLLKNTSDSLHYDIKKCYSDLPWYRKSNYSVLYTKAKQESGALWTQSFSAFATLAALWNVAYASGRITELMAAVGSGPSWYGGYDS